MTNFLPPKLIMIDCEMSGVLPGTDELLQVSAIILRLENFKYVEEKVFDVFLHSRLKPKSEFDNTYLSDIYRKCNNSVTTPAMCASYFKDFVGSDVGITPCGDCVITDLEFLYNYRIIDRNYFLVDTPVPGTLNYEIFDLNAIKALSRTKKGYTSDTSLPFDSGVHNALVDCRNQTKELNHYLEVLLGV